LSACCALCASTNSMPSLSVFDCLRRHIVWLEWLSKQYYFSSPVSVVIKYNMSSISNTILPVMYNFADHIAQLKTQPTKLHITAIHRTIRRVK
jgi:hypothetical protein